MDNSHWAEDSRHAPVFYVAYVGPSMNPTLKEPDLLEVIPYRDRTVRVGDVIFFMHPERDSFVVHRVTRATPQGIFTRGDNNAQHDAWCLQEKDIRGQVVAAWRGSQRRVIAGGGIGQVRLLGLTTYGRFFYQLGAYLMHWVESFLVKPGQLAWLFPARLQPRVIFFQANNAPIAYLLWKKQIIGRFDPKQNRWIIRFPFRWLTPKKILDLVPYPTQE
jgi:signal peptidase I